MDTNKTETSERDPPVDLLKEALEKAGKGTEEIDSVRTVDAAQVAADSGRSRKGVMQEAILSLGRLDLEFFACRGNRAELTDSVSASVLDNSIELVVAHREAGTLLDENGKVASSLIAALAQSGYWGMPIATDWGGSGASKYFLGRAMVKMGSEGAEIIGGLLSIERLIGAAGPVNFRGTDDQKDRILRPMADGTMRSGFAGTERYVGCNITKVRTYGIEDGDDIVVYGDKLFISNAWYGHCVALFLRIGEELRVLIAQLPEADCDEFQIVNYPIHALRQIHNKGLRFNGLRIPKKNLLPGDGLSIIFHDLDDGRFAVAATAAARMRRILASGIPWVKFRETFGVKLEKREYIRYLLALQAAYIAGSDALIDWSSSLIDAGYQGDVSSMITKTKATDWLRQCSTELGMFTHGGRFVLVGHTIGDNLADDLVSSVYEGPNPMLGKAAMKALIKAFVEEHLLPVFSELAKLGIKMSDLRFNSLSDIKGTFGYLWKHRAALSANRKVLLAEGKPLISFLWKTRRAPGMRVDDKGLDSRFADHLKAADKAWRKWRKNFVARAMILQERLADEDLIMLNELYEPLTDIVAMLCAIAASRHAITSGDAGTAAALNMLCLELRCKLVGETRYSRRYKKAVHETAELILAGDFRQIERVPQPAILQPYDEAEQAITKG